MILALFADTAKFRMAWTCCAGKTKPSFFLVNFVCCKDGLIKKGNENDLFWLNLWPDCRLFCFLFFFPLPVSLFNYVTIILFHWPLHFKPQWTDSRTNFSIAYYLLAISHQWLFSDVSLIVSFLLFSVSPFSLEYSKKRMKIVLVSFSLLPPSSFTFHHLIPFHTPHLPHHLRAHDVTCTESVRSPRKPRLFVLVATLWFTSLDSVVQETNFGWIKITVWQKP